VASNGRSAGYGAYLEGAGLDSSIGGVSVGAEQFTAPRLLASATRIELAKIHSAEEDDSGASRALAPQSIVIFARSTM